MRISIDGVRQQGTRLPSTERCVVVECRIFDLEEVRVVARIVRVGMDEGECASATAAGVSRETRRSENRASWTAREDRSSHSVGLRRPFGSGVRMAVCASDQSVRATSRVVDEFRLDDFQTGFVGVIDAYGAARELSFVLFESALSENQVDIPCENGSSVCGAIALEVTRVEPDQRSTARGSSTRLCVNGASQSRGRKIAVVDETDALEADR